MLDLKSHAGEEADKNRLRKKIGEEAELQQARNQQKSGGDQRDEAGEFEIALTAERCQA